MRFEGLWRFPVKEWWLWRENREASEGVEYDFYLTEHEFGPVWLRILILAYCPIKLIYLW